MARFARLGIAIAVGMAVNAVLASGIASEIPSGTSVPDRQARISIAEAQLALNRARDTQALWTVAEEALDNARRALEGGNSPLAIEQARLASEFAELGIEQKNFPLVR